MLFKVPPTLNTRYFYNSLCKTTSRAAHSPYDAFLCPLTNTQRGLPRPPAPGQRPRPGTGCRGRVVTGNSVPRHGGDTAEERPGGAAGMREAVRESGGGGCGDMAERERQERLREAAALGDAEEVRRLVEMGVGLNSQNEVNGW